MKCLKCEEPFDAHRRRLLGRRKGTDCLARITIFLNGHPCTYSYWRCAACDWYTIEAYSDRWDGRSPRSELGPWPPEIGARCVELVRACPSPFDEECTCESHTALYLGTPRQQA